MQRRFDFYGQENVRTTFVWSEDSVWLERLCGLDCGLEGENSAAPGARGLFTLQGADGISTAGDFMLTACIPAENEIELAWKSEESGLVWKSRWALHPVSGIWSRKDALVNSGETALTLRRALPRFVFSPADMDLYAQASTWAHENQGAWIDLPAGELSLYSEAGRTNQGFSPYVFLRPKGGESAAAFHLLPRGDWVIRVSRADSASDPAALYTALELGLSDDDLRLEIPPGTACELPEVLIQPVPSDEPEAGAPGLQRYILDRFFSGAGPDSAVPPKKYAPLVYNTWFDAFDSIDAGRLRGQLAAAREVGCEVFVVDAGWYGSGAGAWDQLVGDWSEKQAAAFHGRMRAFADEVRAAGLGFGLWMEPERFTANAPAVKAHPDWFLAGRWGYLYPDFSQNVSREYVLGEISRVIETYHLVWLKVDFNLEMGKVGDNLASYYQRWYGLLDALRRRHPETFFEGCASGGMRLDLNTLTRFDGHFLSDNVNPLDVLRITQGALLRAPPGRLTRWAVLRPPGGPAPLDPSSRQVLTPGGGSWEGAFQADVDFVCRAALPGMFGYSGDLAGLSAEVRARLRHHSAFYKRWRAFITGSVCNLLTPVSGLRERGGWIAFQLQNPEFDGANLVFVYRLDDGAAEKRILLRGLNPEQRYAVSNDDLPDGQPGIFTGKQLTSSGLPMQLVDRYRTALLIVTPEPSY